ncbi:MAG TPA: hypothetical protein VIV55_14330 [Flavobacterium sp.]
MKTYIYIIITLAFISCHSDDGDSHNPYFNPPEWLIGTWDHSQETAFGKSYIITNKTVILEYQNGDHLDYKEHLMKNPNETLIEHEISDTEYRYTIRDKSSYETLGDYTVTFVKISNNELRQTIETMHSISTSTYYKRN